LPASRNGGDLRKTVFGAIAVAAIYFLFANIGLYFMVQPDGFSGFWPAAGILPAALLILRKNDRIPTIVAVFAVLSAANGMAGIPPRIGIAYASVHCAESVAAAWALGRITRGQVGTLGTGDYFRFLFSCAFGVCGGFATLGAAASAVLGGNPSFLSAWFLWWAASATGMMLITPLTLSLTAAIREKETVPKDRLVEGTLLAAALCIATAVVFGRPSDTPVNALSMVIRPWALLIPMMWASLRMPPRFVLVCSLLLWSIGIFLTSQGYGPYRVPGIPIEAAFATLFAFLTVSNVFSYVTASLLRDAAEGRRKVEESRAWFSRLFQESRAVLFVLDPETGKIVAANPAAADFYGYPEEKLTSMNIGEINTLPPKELRERLDAARRSNITFFEFRHRLADGSMRDVEVYTGPSSREGKTYLFSIVHDVTQRKRAERDLEKTRALLEETQAITKMGGWEYDAADGRVTWTNEVYRICGVGPGYDPGDPVRGFGSFAPHSAPLIERAFRRSVETGEPFDLELELVRPGGERIWVRVIGKATLRNGKVARVSGNIMDITERKRIGEERRNLERQVELAQKRESLGTMAGGIAHQFNNLLTGVLGYIELAMASLPPSSGAGDHLREAEESARRAAEFSRLMLIYVGQGVRRKELCEVGRLVQDVLPLIRTALPGNVRLEVDVPPGGPMATLDPSDFQQVLSNLFTNAWESIGRNDGVVRISVRTVRDTTSFPGINFAPDTSRGGPWACLEVADTGGGMTPGTLDRVFDPFFSTKFTGRGLGLPVTQGIVRHYGGAIFVDSAPGRGTTISVLFPVSEPHSPAFRESPLPGTISVPWR
jgi:PAS domain S-box-containing protein